MRAFVLFFFSFFAISTFSQVKHNSTGFIENKGQIVDQKSRPNPSVKYLLNTNGLNVQLREKGFSYDVYETEKNPLTKKDKDFYSSNPNFDNGIKTPDYSLKYKYHRIDIDFLNANPNTQLIAEEKSKDYDNYYNIVHSPEGIINVHKYQKVTYKNIYNQIDVVFFIPNDSTKAVEYNFIIKPGGKISDIQLQFRGGKTELLENKIRMQLRFGGMEETIPMSWTEQKNGKSEIKINYKKIKKNVYGFEGDLNSSEKTIVIDPVPIRLWGTYYGGNDIELAYDITSDINNNIYISGLTYSTNNMATSDAHLSSMNSITAGFIAKFDSNGMRSWGSYYLANIINVKVDNNLNVYFSGQTLISSNISTPGTHQPIKSNYNDGYLVKFNSLGIRQWGTYFGGEKNDFIHSMAFDNLNNVFLCGETNSNTQIASINSHQSIKESSDDSTDAFIAKFNDQGLRLWATYYGGENPDGLFNCFVNNDNFLYLTGVTHSTSNISTPGSYQTTNLGGSDGMILKFDLNGNLIWGTYIGGEENDFLGLKGDLVNNNIYLIGPTYSTTNIATPGTFFETYQLNHSYGSSNALIKFDLINQTKVWGTYFTEKVHQLSVNNLNEVYFCGETYSYTGIATPDGYQTTRNNYLHVYLIKLNENSQRVWGTYYSGDRATQNAILEVDNSNSIYLYGNANGNSTGITTPNSHQYYQASNEDTFLVKFLDCQSSTSVNSNSPICIGNNLELSASGGTNYSWTGPNGFTSTDQNPIILNSNASHSGQYSCEITGTGDCDNTVTINVVVGDFEMPIPTNTNLPVITGDCNTVISTIPTATDNCAGTIIATTTNPLTYSIPGSYTITWNYNDGNGNTSSQTQNVTISSVALPTPTSEQQFCIQENATLNNIVISGQNIKWYDAITSGNLLPITTLLQNGTTYYASQTINGCESARVPVLVTIQNTAAPTGNQNQSFCSTENATLNNIAVTGTDVIWYNSLGGSTILSTSTLLQNGGTYYASQTINGCESPTRLAVSIQLINTLNANNYSEAICDDLNNRTEIVNLSNYNGALIASSGNIFKYYYSLNGAQNQLPADEIQNSNNYNLSIGNNIVYVRIESPNTCFQIVTLDLNLVSKPFVNINDVMPICEGSSITIDAGSGFDNYLWSTNDTNNSITITQPGNYSVIVSENHGSLVCSTTKNFTVVNSNIGTISEIITSDWTQNENTISVLLSSNSSGNYEYSLNGIDFQDNNTFYGLENGEYTVYVRDKNGCGVSSEDVYVLMYPKFFTPNGDGYNDYWKIKLSENEPNISITIFDRYGKLIKQFDSTSNGWDGTLNNKALPATDYWFVVIREGGKEHRGHFTLKR
ncbi:T9SS type B sorting domain-containing protein [Flavobacterium cucumis]|uniref:Gliding motility-associated C-terminal domain-containing protein n=1 Tax=Flavobacterium cucumis TaxID=416016 RepID=A0A1M7ZS89_9FLAO|nr:T9SS type B sorting domain-containing protein [Flavobacterium cucumis]SHO71765.1 gliding motility-associated C-terminal domain-containing protein [Flavobacterium cucumis]